MSTQPQAIILALLLTLPVVSMAATHFNNPPAAFVVQTRAGGPPDEFSSVVEFSRVEFESGVALKVQLPDGQSLAIPKNEVGQIFWYPDPMAVLASTEDASKLNLKRAEAANVAKRFPKAKAICERIITGIDADLQKLAGGQTRLRGVWQSDTAAAPGNPSLAATASDFASLNITGTIYSHVTIGRLEKGALQLQHDGGVVRVPLDRAPQELLAKLPSKPELLSGYQPLKQFTLEGANLQRAVQISEDADTILILHDRGITKAAKKTLTAEQLQTLASTTPQTPSNPVNTDPASQAADVANGKLMMERGEGPPQVGKGWKASAAERQEWEAAGQEKLSTPSDFLFFKNLLAGHFRGDPALDPSLPIPHAKESIAFINSRIAPLELGYNNTNHCMVIRRPEGDIQTIGAAFRAAELNANVHFKQTDDGMVVVLEGGNMKEAFSLYTLEDGGKGKSTLWRDRVTEIHVPVEDLSDAKRVARAFAYLIVVLGGRSSSL